MSRETRAVLIAIGVCGACLLLILGVGGRTPSYAAFRGEQAGAALQSGAGSLPPQGRDLAATEAATLTMVVVPSGDPEQIARAAEDVAALVEQSTGHTVFAYVAGCYGAAVDALATGDADFGWLPATPYVIAHDRYGVAVKLVAVRFGSAYYRGQFLVRKDSGIDDLADLAGKNFAFPDALSASGFLYPAVHISRTQGVTYATFFGDTVFAGSHDAVVAAVYDSDYAGTPIDGGAAYEDARNAVLGDYPDVFTETKVIAYTDPIPNDTVSVRAGLDPVVAGEVVSGLLAAAASPEGLDALSRLYGIEGLQLVDDSDYDVVRDVVSAFGLEYASCGESVVAAPGSETMLVHAPGGGITTTVRIPGAALTQAVQVRLDPIPAITYRPASADEVGPAFGLGVVVSGTSERLLSLAAPFTITIDYDESALSTVREDSLDLYYWDGSQWLADPSSALDTDNNVISVAATQVRRWALLGKGGITMVTVPTGDAESTARASERVATLLAEQTGHDVYAFVAGCYGAAVDAMVQDEADIGFLPPATYVLAHDRFGVEAKLVTERRGATTYRGQFIVRQDSGIDDLADLAGKNFAFPDPQSSSGFLYPAVHISRTQGITYAAFFSETVFAGDHNAVVRAVYDGAHGGTPINGGATYEDARQAVVGEIPDVYTATKVIDFTDYIPNDAMSVKPGLDAAVAQAVSDGLLELAGTEEGQAALQDLTGATGLQTTDDSAYAFVRETVAAFGLEYELCSAGTGITPEAGGAVSYTMQNGLSTTLDIPTAAVSEPVKVAFSPLAGLTYVPKGLADAGLAFRVTAAVSSTNEPVTTLLAPYTITVRYDAGALGGIAEATLALHYWNGRQWMAEPTSQVNSAQRVVVARPNHFSMWAVLGERRVYLPLVLRAGG